MGTTESQNEVSNVTEKVMDVLRPQGLGIYEIPQDGHCLYRAIEHQLSREGSKGPALGYKELRQMTADFMEEFREDFRVFLVDCDEEMFSAYCRGVRGSSWGGDLEINALSRLLQRCIKVFQGDKGGQRGGGGGLVLVAGEQFDLPDQPALLVAFHRHDMAAAHYNSVVPIAEQEFLPQERHETLASAVAELQYVC